MELYKSGEGSIGKAAEIAEMSTADFKDVLAERGIMRVVKSSEERVKKGLQLIKKIKR